MSKSTNPVRQPRGPKLITKAFGKHPVTGKLEEFDVYLPATRPAGPPWAVQLWDEAAARVAVPRSGGTARAKQRTAERLTTEARIASAHAKVSADGKRPTNKAIAKIVGKHPDYVQKIRKRMLAR